jgi:hypothetical protein
LKRTGREEDVFEVQVVQNSRPDGEVQYKATIPKRLGDLVTGSKHTIEGYFVMKVNSSGKEEKKIRLELYPKDVRGILQIREKIVTQKIQNASSDSSHLLCLLIGPTNECENIFSFDEKSIMKIIQLFPFSNASNILNDYATFHYKDLWKPVQFKNAKLWRTGVMELSGVIEKSPRHGIDLVSIASSILDNILLIHRLYRFVGWSGSTTATILLRTTEPAALILDHKSLGKLDELYLLPQHEPYVAFRNESILGSDDKVAISQCRQLIRKVAFGFGFQISEKTLDDVLKYALEGTNSVLSILHLEEVVIPSIKVQL